MAEPEDLGDPWEEGEYWDSDELTTEELASLYGAVPAGDDDAGPGGRERLQAGDSSCWRRAEGSTPDLIAAVLAAAGDPALMTDADLVESLARWHSVAARAAGREMRATEELLRRRRPRVWDRRADRAEDRREEAGEAAGAGAPERVMPTVVASREAASEIALALTATEYAAQVQAELTADLSRRLPAAFSELDAGQADLARVRVLAEGTRFLSDEDAGKVDCLLAPRLGQLTTGDLRDRVRRAVIRIDPGAAERRRKRAERKARFALYGNDDHTATAAVERIPAQLGAAVKARVSAIARAARAAGMTDPMPLLEAKVATGLLLDTLPDIPPPRDGDPPGGTGPAGPRDPGPAPDSGGDDWPAHWFGTSDPPASDPPAPAHPAASGTSGPGPSDPPPGPARPAPGPGLPAPDGSAPDGSAPDVADNSLPDDCASDVRPPGPDSDATDPGALAGDARDPDQQDTGAMAWPPVPVQAGAAAPGCPGIPAWLRPASPGRIRLTVPWRTLTGMGPEPGELSWTGTITPAQTRELAAAAAADPSCPWRVIVTDDQGRAIAITTVLARRRAGPVPTGLISEVTLTIAASTARALASHPSLKDCISRALSRPAGEANPAPPAMANLAGLLARVIPAANLAAGQAAAAAAADQAAGGCAHIRQTPGYRVPGLLRRWLNTRDRTCRNPICRQPATACDQDHTLAYHRGGRTCPCGLGALCRTHHKLKQLPGWHLSQDAHGTFTWRTPAGLTYRKEPHRYPV